MVRSEGSDTDFGYVCTLTFVKVMARPCVMDNNCVNLDRGHDTAFGYGLWTTIVWNTVETKLDSKELWPIHRFWVCYCDLDLWDITLGQDHETSLGYGKLLCEISFRSNMAERSYGPYTDFGYVCTVTLTFEIWPLAKIMTHPWVMEHYYVKYHSDPTRQWGVMAHTQIFGMCSVPARQK